LTSSGAGENQTDDSHLNDDFSERFDGGGGGGREHGLAD